MWSRDEELRKLREENARLRREIEAREAQKQAALKALQSERRDDWCIGLAVDILIRDA